MWAFEEVLPLFEYLKQTQATARPLAFSGFDPQISSRTGVATRPAFFQRVVGVLDPVYANEVATLRRAIHRSHPARRAGLRA